jgi:hypothetical protein
LFPTNLSDATNRVVDPKLVSKTEQGRFALWHNLDNGRIATHIEIGEE